MLDLLLNTNPIVLAISAAVFGFAVVLALLQRRRLRQQWRQRLEASEQQSEGGETSVLPLPDLANAVEVLDLEELLAGEDAPVAAAARRQLEQLTDISTAPDTFFPLPMRAPPAVPAAGPLRIEPTLAPVSASVALAGHGPGAATALAVEPVVAAAMAAPPSPLAPGVEPPVPVRELALAWFEARGYRASSASPAVRPIELVLRHRQDATRAYAFVVEQAPVTTPRATALAEHARSIGLSRLLVAAESGFDPDTRRQFRREGVRLVDQAEMQREFDKLEISVAAKIIAVARNRSRLRR